ARGLGHEVVVGALARRDRRRGNVRNAVLPPRRIESMPVQAGRHVERVLEANLETLAFVERQPPRARRLEDAVALGGLARDLDHTICKPQRLLGRPVRAWRQSKACGCSEERSTRQVHDMLPVRSAGLLYLSSGMSCLGS